MKNKHPLHLIYHSRNVTGKAGLKSAALIYHTHRLLENEVYFQISMW